jgi:acyl-coenzyme A thioesterase PaaI-like protein
VIVGPARTEARIIRNGKTSIVLLVEVTDVGRDKLAAVSTIAFTVLAPRT